MSGTSPTLDEVASEIGLSPYHFQRLFRRWAGISPKRFLEYLTVHHAKALLRESMAVMDTAYTLGLSSPARLHDQFVSIEAVTPGEYKTRGQGVVIYHGIHPGPFGDMFLAQTERGVCTLSFVGRESPDQELERLLTKWPSATFIEDADRTAITAASVFDPNRAPAGGIHLTVRGTNFQINVWKALLRIPPGHVVSYSTLARALNKPKAARSVASAVAANPVGYLIPCHRVIRGSGETGVYHWGK